MPFILESRKTKILMIRQSDSAGGTRNHEENETYGIYNGRTLPKVPAVSESSMFS